MLALLFGARLAMAIQFQSVAALSSGYQAAYGVGLDSIGFLIGLYLSPGLLLALPSGAIGAKLGGKRGVGLGLLIMAIGSLWAIFADTWDHEVAARLVAGIGGVLLNVLMTKLVTDWFGKADLATAMALYVSSWPVGIGLALLILPGVEASLGANLVLLATVVAALVAFMALYRDPPDVALVRPGPLLARPSHAGALPGVVMAGLVWGLINAGLAVAFSFGAALLIEQWVPPDAAAQRTSLILWGMALTIPIGGLIADRTGRSDLVIALSVVGFAVALAVLPRFGDSLPAFLLLGAVGGLSAGPIMALPAGVLPPDWRAQGMGVFFTLYYAIMALAPPVAGAAAEAIGSVAAAFWVGALMVAACLPPLLALRRYRLPGD